MSAKHGSAVTYRRLLGCAFALVLALSALFAASASATKYTVVKSDVALGDSLAFGYSAQLFNENFPTEPVSAFEKGYANQYFSLSHAREAGSQLQNLGCPGETTDSMIGNGPVGAALDPTEGEAPCAYHAVGFPLHKEYGAGKSQLEAALETIAVDAGSSTPVTTLTMQIGANDQLHAIAKCEAEVKAEYEAEGKSKYGGATPEAAVKNCIEAHVSGLFNHILKNVGSILFALRHGSLFGGVDYTGKIVIQGGYDPYGNVFGTGELLVGSNGLASLLNFYENKEVTDEGAEAAAEGHEAFHACYANPQPTFNTGKKSEPLRLQKWTNMANFTESNGKKNGPDIHPTPSGYKELAKIMLADCGAVE